MFTSSVPGQLITQNRTASNTLSLAQFHKYSAMLQASKKASNCTF